MIQIGRLGKYQILFFAVYALAAGVSFTALAQAPDLDRMDVVERATPDGPVALVDGMPVDREDFLFLYRSQLTLLSMQSRAPSLDDTVRIQVGMRSLGELIQREILWQEAGRRKLTVSEEEVTTAYDIKLKGLQEQLAAEGNAAATEEQILAKAGQTKAEARESVRKTLLVNKVWEAIGREAKVSVSDEEAAKFYEARPQLFERPGGLHLKQIFVRPHSAGRELDEAAWSAARARMEKALARIRSGQSFEAAARDVSEAPDAKDGGDMGMIPVAQLPPFYVEGARDLKPGETSNIIQSEHGFHVIKLVETEEGGKVPLAEARDRIKSVLVEAKKEDAVNAFCAPILNDPSRVRIFLSLEVPPESFSNSRKPKAELPLEVSQ